MKTWGWILLVLGTLSFIGLVSTGRNPTGPLFWVGLGLYLIHRANRREKDKRDKEKWSAGKAEEAFAGRPAVISNPSKDLFTNQKYAIIGFLAYVQGASPLSAYDDEATLIMQDMARSLGLTQSEVVKYIKMSMTRDPGRETNRMLDTLDTIRDREYLKGVCRKAMRIARISGDADAVETVENVMRELKL